MHKIPIPTKPGQSRIPACCSSQGLPPLRCFSTSLSPATAPVLEANTHLPSGISLRATAWLSRPGRAGSAPVKQPLSPASCSRGRGKLFAA